MYSGTVNPMIKLYLFIVYKSFPLQYTLAFCIDSETV